MQTLLNRGRWLRTLVPALGAFAATGALAADCDPRMAGSPQFVAADCVFQNPPNPDAKPSERNLALWMRFFFEKKVGTVPIDAIPVRPVTRAALDALDATGSHVIRLGHSSHLLKLQGRYWLIDPVFSERASPVQFAGPKRFHPTPLALADLPPIEGLLLSHDHYDHLDKHTIETLREQVQRYFVPLGVGARLRAMGVAAERIEEFDWWQESRHAGVRVVAAPAQHFSGRTLWDRNKTLWASWAIESGPHKISYSGDTGYFGGFRQIGERLGPFDVALMENGAYDKAWPSVHMTPEETVQAFGDLRGKLLYVVHNSTFDLAFHTWRDPLDRIADLAQKQKLPIATPEIGEVLSLGAARENKLWWKNLR